MGKRDPSPAAEFSSTFGRALLLWTEIERQLFELFWLTLRPPEAQHVFIIWSRMRHIRVQFNTLDALLRVTLENKPDSLNQWVPLSGRIASAISDRNKLAHGNVAWDDSEDLPKRMVLVSDLYRGPDVNNRSQIDLQKVHSTILTFQSVLQDIKSFHAVVFPGELPDHATTSTE